MNVFTGITDRVHYHILGNGTHVGGHLESRTQHKNHLDCGFTGKSFNVGCVVTKR